MIWGFLWNRDSTDFEGDEIRPSKAANQSKKWVQNGKVINYICSWCTHFYTLRLGSLLIIALKRSHTVDNYWHYFRKQVFRTEFKIILLLPRMYVYAYYIWLIFQKVGFSHPKIEHRMLAKQFYYRWLHSTPIECAEYWLCTILFSQRFIALLPLIVFS